MVISNGMSLSNFIKKVENLFITRDFLLKKSSFDLIKVVERLKY